MPSGASFATAKCIPHCSPMTIATGSSNVLVEGKPAARMFDKTTPHLLPVGKKCVPHAAPIVSGSSTVMVNGRPFARIGDALGGCTAIAQGSLTVIVGG